MFTLHEGVLEASMSLLETSWSLAGRDPSLCISMSIPSMHWMLVMDSHDLFFVQLSSRIRY
jgi:hypothetical protein